jgi:hypothetical protein
MPRASTLRSLLCFLGAAAVVVGCEAEFPSGSPYESPSGRALLDNRVEQDVGAMLMGMRRAEELRTWTTRLRRGD